ncbi:hypothetical protein T05_12968 [Trichinella murrelli]|uniref:Uncharacterized protein n=1 Tax=Trichinella murrelli TaxID=144512 RepID=A0A0V0T6R0_9BILA|nr:hypothetical protein T05_12968 [Trichinella murrelli]
MKKTAISRLWRIESEQQMQHWHLQHVDLILTQVLTEDIIQEDGSMR